MAEVKRGTLEYVYDHFDTENPIHQFFQRRTFEVDGVDHFEEMDRALMRLIIEAAHKSGEFVREPLVGKLDELTNNLRAVQEILQSRLELWINENHRMFFSGPFGQLIPAAILDRIGKHFDEQAEKIKDSKDYQATAEEFETFRREYTVLHEKLINPLLDDLSELQRRTDLYRVSISADALWSALSERVAARILKQENRVKKVADQSIDNMDAITNRSSRGEQSKFFQQMRDEEETSATNWTRGVFAFTVLGILVIVGLFSWDAAFSSLSGATGAVVKALIALPLFGLATYCGRVAAEHRRLSRHAKVLDVQVRTIESYIQIMPDEQKTEMRALLGRRLFSQADIVASDNGSVGVLPVEALPLLEKLADALREVGKRGGGT